MFVLGRGEGGSCLDDTFVVIKFEHRFVSALNFIVKMHVPAIWRPKVKLVSRHTPIVEIWLDLQSVLPEVGGLEAHRVLAFCKQNRCEEQTYTRCAHKERTLVQVYVRAADASPRELGMGITLLVVLLSSTASRFYGPNLSSGAGAATGAICCPWLAASPPMHPRAPHVKQTMRT